MADIEEPHAARRSVHVAPTGLHQIAQHYIGDLVYGANDGIITTFAVVAGVSGGDLSRTAVLVVGVANLVADGLSMGVGNYLSIRSRESALAAQNRPEEEAQPVRHGVATIVAFVSAGAVPLLPFALPLSMDRFATSTVITLALMFVVGAARSLVTLDRWWRAGLEMLGLGAAVAAAAYGSGAVVARWIAP
jgi:VIT1/CCC1 family predicted Fe2+/Mn2+ transporter